MITYRGNRSCMDRRSLTASDEPYGSVLHSCVGYHRPVRAISLDGPLTTNPRKHHIVSLSPPSIHVTRQCHPQLPLGAESLDQSQELAVLGLPFPTDRVVGMYKKAHQAVLRYDRVHLLAP